MHCSSSLLGLLAIASTALSSPVSDKFPRAAPPSACQVVKDVVSILSIQKATPYCSSLLSIVPKTVTRTNIITASTDKVNVVTTTDYHPAIVTDTAVVTHSVPYTSVSTNTITKSVVVTGPNPTFRPGEPPAPTPNAKRDLDERAAPATPVWASSIAQSALSAGCSCLSLTAPTITSTALATQTVIASRTSFTAIPLTSVVATLTITTTVDATYTVAATTDYTTTTTVTTNTVYPCASAALADGTSGSYLALNPGYEGSQYTQTSPAATLADCCNLCVFGERYCFFARYDAAAQTCVQSVVFQLAVDHSPNAPPATCDLGNAAGANYGPGVAPGAIAGPCGQAYFYA